MLSRIMRNRMLLTLAVSVIATCMNDAYAQEAYKYFVRGFYGSLEGSYGMVLDGNEPGYPDYGIKIATGYRLCPQLVASIGFEGVNSMTTGTTAVPVFVQFRSDFIDAKVSPYAMLELGYAFQFTVCKRSQEIIKVNDKIFTERLGNMTLDQYLSQFFPDRREEELDKLKQFPNGSRQYISYDRYSGDMCFSKDGPYASLTLGLSWKTGVNRMNVGITAGVSEYYLGTSVRTYENQYLDFGCVYPDPDGNKVIVRGKPPHSGDRYKFSFRVCLGFSF